jgi:lactate permease
VSNYVGPQLVDILSSLAAIAGMVLVLRFWKPKDTSCWKASTRRASSRPSILSGEVLLAWSPFLMLVVCVLAWGNPVVKDCAEQRDARDRMAGPAQPRSAVPAGDRRGTPYAAIYTLNWLSASGSACLLACLLSILILRAPLSVRSGAGDYGSAAWPSRP